jgi:hypothetical protein
VVRTFGVSTFRINRQSLIVIAGAGAAPTAYYRLQLQHAYGRELQGLPRGLNALKYGILESALIFDECRESLRFSTKSLSPFDLRHRVDPNAKVVPSTLHSTGEPKRDAEVIVLPRIPPVPLGLEPISRQSDRPMVFAQGCESGASNGREPHSFSHERLALDCVTPRPWTNQCVEGPS